MSRGGGPSLPRDQVNTHTISSILAAIDYDQLDAALCDAINNGVDEETNSHNGWRHQPQAPNSQENITEEYSNSKNGTYIAADDG